jgi:CheY-like chemotaxis protein
MQYVPISNKRRVVLQIDDSGDDTFLLGYAFEEAGIANHLRAVPNGREGLNYLDGIGEFADRENFPLPCLVLLDINMPGVDGFDVLKAIRAECRFSELPVCMYSASAEEVDIKRALQLGADCYVRKPISLSTQVEFARHIAVTWFSPPPQPGYPRILLRKSLDPRHGTQAGCYLQSNGDWSKNRESARTFAHAVEAHWWAEEQAYLDAEIILARSDPSADSCCLRT